MVELVVSFSMGDELLFFLKLAYISVQCVFRMIVKSRTVTSKICNDYAD